MSGSKSHACMYPACGVCGEAGLPEEREARRQADVIPARGGQFVELRRISTGNDESRYVTKDSGQRQEFSSGMVRDVQTGKPRYDLVDLPMLKRWAELMARGAEKYGDDNWKLASGEAELRRFRASAFRHLVQWFEGDTEEDHAAAVFFNVAGAEYVASRLRGEA